MTQQHDKVGSFDGLGIAPKLLDALKKVGFKAPTPIQHQAIPVAIQGKDIVGIAQTGTGKTMAFGIPLIQQIAKTQGQGLVILPTRELALQVEESIRSVGNAIGIRTVVLIGGAPMGPQIQGIRRNPHVIIATPGRLVDHMQQKTLSLNKVNVLVLDEADRMFDMGFAPQLNEILRSVPKVRQTMLFSATMPSQVMNIASKHMKLPVRVEIARAGTIAKTVEQELFIVRKEDKPRLLEKLLSEYEGSILVFSRTKHGARKICRNIRHMGHSAAEIHSERSLAQRKRALAGFKSGEFRVLVATDIAARGIDVTGIALVVNFDLPDNSEDYVHRIGRTGRAGKTGKAISFVAPDQRGKVKEIERLVRMALSFKQLPDLPPARVAPAYSEHRSYDRNRRNSNLGRGSYAYSRHRRSGRRSDPRRASSAARAGGRRKRQPRIIH